MRKYFILLFVLLSLQQAHAQQKWFSVYDDSTALAADGNKIVNEMADQIQKANPLISLNPVKAIKNTTPYLIYVDFKKAQINLPLWEEVIAPHKKFFAEVSGGEKNGKEVFGLFFNGFYLTHELGHSLFNSVGRKFDDAYNFEYDANVVAILYWKQKEKKNLRKCYRYAKKMLQILKNPVPADEDYKKYITKHYEELSTDPYKYGYIQFSQFVEIYEDKKLPDFNAYIKSITVLPKKQ